jgi:serine/threonine-protein kinase
VAADPHTDQRADLYALGVMAYEMLVSQPPFVAPTPQALIAAHFSRTPESMRQTRPSVPATFDDLVSRFLAKQPADRFQRAANLLPLLDQIGHPSGAEPTVSRVATNVPSPNGAVTSPPPRASRRSSRALRPPTYAGGLRTWIPWSCRRRCSWPGWLRRPGRAAGADQYTTFATCGRTPGVAAIGGGEGSAEGVGGGAAEEARGRR